MPTDPLACAGQAQACLIRAAVLDDDGAPASGPGNLYVSRGLVTLAWTPQITTGQVLNQDDGCGERCLHFEAPDNLDRLNLTMQICAPEPELLAMLAGGTVHELGSLVTGWGHPTTGVVGGPTDVSVEFWANVIIADSIAGQVRYVFPRTRKWSRSGSTHGNSPLDVTFTAIAVPAGDWGDGPGLDWSMLSDEPVEIYDWAVENQPLPEPVCGAQPLVLTP